MPNPLTDELSDETKAELAALFAELRIRFRRMGYGDTPQLRPHPARFWERSRMMR